MTMLFAAALAVPGPRADAQPTTLLRLPTGADAVPAASGISSALGDTNLQVLLPGPVSDRELVQVGVAPDGAVRSVRVRQRLSIHGVGDFAFELPGPAADVTALPDSDTSPGLRSGTVIWEGFSAGRKRLAAAVTLKPASERARLPLRVEIAASVDGRPLTGTGGTNPAGAVTLELTIRNVSAAPVGLTEASGDPVQLASVLDRIARSLRKGRRPVPGRRGIPEALSVDGSSDTVTESIDVPFRIQGSLRFAAGTLQAARGRGGRITTDSAGPEVSFDRLLGGGSTLRLRVRVAGTTNGFRMPVLSFRATPSVPSASTVAPPGGGTWSDLVAGDPGAVDPRDLVRRIMRAMWQAARMRQFDAYLGNPDVTGPASATFAYTSIRASLPGPVQLPVREESLLGTIAFVLLALVVLFGVALAWARS